MIEDHELIELEREIADLILFSKNSIYEISEILKPSDILDKRTKEIYEVALGLLESSNNYDALQILELVSESAREYIYSHDGIFVPAINAIDIAKKIKEYAIVRQAKNKLRFIFMNKTEIGRAHV